MKKLLSVALVLGFLPCLAKKQESRKQDAEKTGVKFQNESGRSVVLFVHDMKSGEKLASPTIRDGGSYFFPTKGGIKYAIKAKEAGRKEDRLKTAMYNLYLRTQDDQGDVRIVEGDEELVFVGNEEADQGGAFVREMWITPQWKRDMKEERRGDKMADKGRKSRNGK